MNLVGSLANHVVLKVANRYGSWLDLRESNCKLQGTWDSYLRKPNTLSRSLRPIVIYRTIADKSFKINK